MIEEMIYLEETKHNIAAYEGKGKGTLPCIGNEIEYRGLSMHELAARLGLSDKDLIDIFEGKRSHRPIVYLKDTDPRMIANNILSYAPTHPGGMLKEEIEYRELNLTELATQMGITDTELIEILDEKRPVTEDYARRFESVLGLSAEWLRNMQSSYDIEAVLIPLRDQWQYEKRLKKRQQQRAKRALLLQESQPHRQVVPVPRHFPSRVSTVIRQRVPA
jgi:addiction module HigA family antidote